MDTKCVYIFMLNSGSVTYKSQAETVKFIVVDRKLAIHVMRVVARYLFIFYLRQHSSSLFFF